MKKSRYAKEQISFALRQVETGTPVAEVIRGMGIAEQTFFRWKKVYAGLGVGELRCVKHARRAPQSRQAYLAGCSVKNVWSAPVGQA